MNTRPFLLLPLCVAFLLLFKTNALAQADSTTLPDYVRNPSYSLTGFGVYGGVELGLHQVNFVDFANGLSCCSSSYGNTIGSGWAAGLTFDQSLTNWLMFDVRAGVNNQNVIFTQIFPLYGLSPNGPEILNIRATHNVQLFSIGIEPALKLRLLPLPTTTTYAPSLYLLAGLGVRYYTQSIFSFQEEITDTTKLVNFLLLNGMVSSKRNVITNQAIPQFNQLQFTPFLGLESDIFLQSEFPSHWLIVPYLRYYFAVGEMAQNLVAREEIPGTMMRQQSVGSWRMDAVQAGLTFKYRAFSLIK
jgi:hypothetical protein